ncbi:MAG: M56 family metallopeptidase [Planctomycetota bacterium]|jgi:beta-lactamase regulating signal transducer with metallopeptidase domain
MISEIFSAESFFWSCLWQSTIFIAAGLLGSFILRYRSARAHQVLLLAIIAAVIVPVISKLVKHYELGLFTAEPASIQSQPENQIIYETAEITSGENIEHKLGTVEKDLTSVSTAPENDKFPLRSVMLYAWIAGSLVLAFRLAVTFILGVRLLGLAIPLDCDRIEQAVHLAKAKLRINKDVMIYSSNCVRSPVIWCWKRKPILLLPSAVGLSENRINWAGVLCHELAHWKRHDHISGLSVELLLCIMPWHPLLWWAKSRLTSLSEQACDDWVVATIQPCTDYAESLLDLTPCGQMAFVPAVVSSKKGLAGRVQRILENNCPNPRTGVLWALAVGIVTICITVGIAFAQRRPAKMDEAKIETPQVQEELKNYTLPVSWKLDYDDGLLPGGAKHWLGQMAEDLASLKFVPTPAGILDNSRKDEEYSFWLHSLQGKYIGQNTLTFEPRDTRSNLKILKPDKYLLKYERRWGKPGYNFRMRCGEFLVDLNEPGMYELRFTPNLWTAEITGSLGGCYAINFEKVGKGPRIRGFAYQHGRPYLLDGLPAGKYRLSAVTQRQSDNVFVSQAEVTVGAKEKATVDIVPAPKGSCSLQGCILGKQNKYKTPWPTSPESQGKWFILIRKPGGGVVEWVDAYEALTMDSLYVVRGINIIQETEGRTRYHIEGVVPGKYTVTAIENPSWSGCVITRQQSKSLTLRAGDEAVVDFDLRGTQQQQKDLSAETDGAKAKEGESAEVRFVHFPNDQSLGTLYIRDIGAESWYKDWEKLGEAKGTVVIPHKKQAKLEVSEEAADDLSPLIKLRADDLQMLCFEWKPVKISSLAPIGNLKGLKALNLQTAKFNSEDFKHLTELSQLEVLRLGDQQLTDGSMQYIGQLTSLRSLALWGTGISDEGLKHLRGLTNLTFLALNNCKITDEGLIYLKNMTALDGLQLTQTKITDEGLAKLKNFTRLKSLLIGYTNITDAGLKHLQGLTLLEIIWINSNPITDKGLAYLSGMKNLKTLFASRTKITDAGLTHLKGLRIFRHLNTSGIGDGGIQHLSKLPALEMLQIHDAEVTKASVPYFKKMGLIKEVLLSGDRIDDDLLDALRTALPGCKIWDPQRSRDYPMAAWRQRFEAVYRLENEQILKRISPPFIPERRDYYLNEHSHQASRISRSPDRFIFHWDGKLKNWGLGFVNTNISSALYSVLRINTFEYEVPEELLSLKMPGDWIVRDEAPREVKLKALEQLLADELGRSIRFEKRTVEREVIIATGKFKFHPPSGTYENSSVHLFCDQVDPDEGSGGGTAYSVSDFLQRLGSRVKMPVIDKTESSEQLRIPYRHHRSSLLRNIKDKVEKTRKLPY